MKVTVVNRQLFVIAVLIAAVAVGIAGAAFGDSKRWAAPVTRWYLSPTPHTELVLRRQIGAPHSTRDDTRQITFVDVNHNTQTTNSSTWERVHLAVPAGAKVARLTLHSIITRGSRPGSTVVYAFARRPGATCCSGPPANPNRPVDFQLQGTTTKNPRLAPMVTQISATGPNGTLRDNVTVDVPIRDGVVEFAWGYRRILGDYPTGDALGVLVFLDGWAR